MALYHECNDSFTPDHKDYVDVKILNQLFLMEKKPIVTPDNLSVEELEYHKSYMRNGMKATAKNKIKETKEPYEKFLDMVHIIKTTQNSYFNPVPETIKIANHLRELYLKKINRLKKEEMYKTSELRVLNSSLVLDQGLSDIKNELLVLIGEIDAVPQPLLNLTEKDIDSKLFSELHHLFGNTCEGRLPRDLSRPVPWNSLITSLEHVKKIQAIYANSNGEATNIRSHSIPWKFEEIQGKSSIKKYYKDGIYETLQAKNSFNGWYTTRWSQKTGSNPTLVKKTVDDFKPPNCNLKDFLKSKSGNYDSSTKLPTIFNTTNLNLVYHKKIEPDDSSNLYDCTINYRLNPEKGDFNLPGVLDKLFGKFSITNDQCVDLYNLKMIEATGVHIKEYESSDLDAPYMIGNNFNNKQCNFNSTMQDRAAKHLRELNNAAMCSNKMQFQSLYTYFPKPATVVEDKHTFQTNNYSESSSGNSSPILGFISRFNKNCTKQEKTVKNHSLILANESTSYDNVCVFCRNSDKNSQFFQTHKIKDEYGRVTCPTLRRFVCPICNATGDNAHTMMHCPLSNDNRRRRISGL